MPYRLIVQNFGQVEDEFNTVLLRNVDGKRRCLKVSNY